MCQVSNQSIAVLYPEKVWWGQNTSVRIRLIEHTEPSDILNCKP